ncbi:MAG: vWA domain-containing protein, partial [candidate division WOR-3 bacterium]
MIFVVASIALLLLGVLAYRQHLAQRATLGLLLLRLGTLLLLCLILTGVRFTRTWIVRPRHVALLLDRSASMAAIRADTLLDRVLAALSLPSRIRRDVWSFADSCRRGNNVPGPNRTRIAAALEQVGRTGPAAVVLVGDGQDNGERSAVEAAGSLGVPVHTIGLGALPEENLAVTQVILPAIIHAGDTADVRVRVVGTGLEPGPVKVRLGDATQVVQMDAGRTELEAGFRSVFARPGPQAITASTESLPSEATFADNQRTVFADVRPGRYYVVYLTNRPSLETRFMLACLADDERVELVPHVKLTGALAVPEADITRADVFIIDGVVEQQSEVALWQAVLRRVRAGAGVLGLAGPEARPGPVLESLLPLAPGSAGGDKVRRGPLTPELTSAG